MRNLKKLLAACVIGVLSFGVLSASHGKLEPLLQPKESGFAPGFISLTKNDIDLYISGEIETQWAFRDKSETLHRTDDDQYSQFVFKSCFDFFSQYGRQKYGKSAVDGLFRLTNYGYWQKEYRYTPLNSSSYYPLFSSTYLEEAWLNVHLGTFVGWLDRHPISVISLINLVAEFHLVMHQ